MSRIVTVLSVDVSLVAAGFSADLSDDMSVGDEDDPSPPHAALAVARRTTASAVALRRMRWLFTGCCSERQRKRMEKDSDPTQVIQGGARNRRELVQHNGGISHDEIRDLLGAYALDAVDKHEADVVGQHLRLCASCSAEVKDHREVASVLWLCLVGDTDR